MKATSVTTAGLVALALAACGGGDKDKGGGGEQPGKGKPPVTLGSKSFTEQTILGELYAQALRAKGYTVNLKANIGQTEIADKALTTGKVDMYPEYTGTTLSVVAKHKAKPKSARAAYQAARRFYATRGQALTEPTPFFNSDALAVKSDFAKENNLRTLLDLKKLGAGATVAGAPEFKTREEGLLGLRRAYGLSQLKFKPLAIGLQYKALASGQVNVAEVFTTDGQLSGSRYKVLRDPKHVFGFQNVALVVSRKVVHKEGGKFEETINAVSEKLTTKAMRQMNAAADINKVPPADVARKFLEANGLL